LVNQLRLKDKIMSMTMTAKVCEHLEATPKSDKIGDIYVRDWKNNLVLFKAGQRLIKRCYGKWYWAASQQYFYCRKFGKNQYELVLKPTELSTTV